ncbi:hypothetical protein [Candidatus Tisiphia endosymbiont of Dioctria rufipes]|uniref:hypothetical protein n=1 Tax=Candidatus Tisiphia endosymbiont of Dioctria rufipes TaxID=3066255 RepID=UPI00312CB8C5
MTSQIGKKAIILSYLSHAYSEQLKLKESLIDFCKDNNFTIIKIIVAKDKYDNKAPCKLIQIVVKQYSYNSPVNLIRSIFKDLHCFLTWVVIGTLLEAKLINKLYVQENILHVANAKKGQVDNFLEMNRNLFTLYFFYFERIVLSTTVTIDDSDDEELSLIQLDLILCAKS